MFNNKIWYYIAGACAILAGACTITTTVAMSKGGDQARFRPQKGEFTPVQNPEPFDPMEADRQDDDDGEKYSQN